MLPQTFIDALKEIETREQCLEAFDAIRHKLDIIARMETINYRIGDAVSFVHSGIRYTGLIEKINQKTVMVRVKANPPFVTAETWRVSSSMLTKVA